MSIKTAFNNIITKLCQQGVSDRANFLKNIGVAGWVLSSLAQTCAIFFNDKIPSKEKRFLIPQEIFDGIINATLFWFITSKAASLGKMLVLKKHILPKSLKNVMENFSPKGETLEKLKDNFISHVTNFGTKENVKTAQNAIEGLGVLTSIAGAILSNNIITPLLRNKFAGMYQKQDLQKLADNAPLNPYFGIPKKDYSKLAQAPQINSFRGFYTSKMKI